MLRVFFLFAETQLISVLSLTGTFYHLKFFFILQYINNSLALSFPLQYFISAQINVSLHRPLLHTACFRAQARLDWGIRRSPVCVLLPLLALLEHLYITISCLTRSRSITSLLGSSSVFSWFEAVTGIITEGRSPEIWLKQLAAGPDWATVAWLEVWPNIGGK